MKHPFSLLLLAPFLFYSASCASQLEEMMQEIKSPTHIITHPTCPQNFQCVLPITSTANYTSASPTAQLGIPSVVLTMCIIGAVFINPYDAPPKKKRRHKGDYPCAPHLNNVPKNTYRHQYKQRHHTPVHSSHGR